MTARLGDHVDLAFGYAFKSAEYTQSADDIRLLRGDNVGQGRLRWVNVARFPASRVAEFEGYKLAVGDVVLAMDRPWIEAGLKYSVVRPSDVPSLLVQRVARLRAKPSLDQGFLRYLIGSRAFLEYVVSTQTGSAVPHISGGQIAEFPLRDLPPVNDQRGIASTLGAIDDKIDSNHRLKQICLDLAVNLYLQAITPEADVVPLKDVGRWLSGGTPSTGHPGYWSGSLPWISAASLKDVYIWSSDRALTSAGRAAATHVVPPGTVLLVVRGMSLKTEIRLGIAQTEVAFGQDCKAILPTKVAGPTLAVALLANRDALLGLVDEAGHGTGRLASDRLLSFEIGIPDNRFIDEQLAVLLQRGAAAARENQRLVELRDALLPALLSGQIRVPEARETVVTS